jgi:signal transduction histidine kinase
MNLIAVLKKLFYRISINGLKDRDNLELLRRIRLLNLSGLLAIAILVFMGFFAFGEGENVLAIIDITSAVLLSSVLIYLGKTGNYNVTSAVGVYFMEVFLFFFAVSGGSGATGHLWSFTLPLFATFLLGAKKGLIASMIYIGIISAIFILPLQSPFFAVYPLNFKIRFSLSFFIVSIFSYHFENLRIIIYRQLISRNFELEAEKRKAEAASRTKTEFLANMSHELRTPLNHIIGFGELLQDQQAGSLNEKQTEYMDDILNSSGHLLSLINDILDLAKVEAGRLELEFQTCELDELIRKAFAIFSEPAEQKGISLNNKTATGGILLSVDTRRFTQILYNLLSNALKFTPAGGSITLSSETANGDLLLSLRDTGIGIEKENLQRVFQSFEQVESKSSRRFQGTGLGLALTRRLVELHRGKIWAESDGVGKGSCFCFTLPVARSGSTL